MNKCARIFLNTLLILVLAASAGQAFASDRKDSQSRKLLQRINSLEQEKAQLSQANSQLEDQVKSVTEQLNQARQNAEAANRKGASLEKALKAADDEKAELSGKLAQSEQQLNETSEILHTTQEARDRLQSSLDEHLQELSACTAKNESLHRVGTELIKQYEEKSCLTTILQKEPLTQLKSAEAENMLEEYRDKLDQELIARQQAAVPKSPDPSCVSGNADLDKAKPDHAAQSAEPRNAEMHKTSRQNSLDRMTHQVIRFFEDTEW